ncbi:MAG: polysaccharide biosynthesis C-terminal domain-containing protein [Actinomycetota bacterium]|nr:polysaccharide biosynthesis C-terminal domain-containing protein [Actinomycetota bacterium]
MPVFLAIPMAMRLYAWHVHGRRVRVPPGFALWLLFLVVMLAGIATLKLTAPGTTATALSSRLISYTDRSASYIAVAVLLLFAGNLTEQECSRRRLACLLGLVGIYAVVGGLGGVIDPSLQLTSPLAYVLPHSVTQNTLVQSWMHPGFSQTQSVLGSATGRPKAPFDYTNTWGNCVTILLPWLLVAWWKTRRKRWMALSIIAISLVPVLYSLNRGVWIGLAFTLAYLAVRLAIKGKGALLGAVIVGSAVMGLLVVATPLHNIVTERLQHQQSNSIRSTLDELSIQDALASPLIGYGDTRHMQGSPQSIAVGPSPGCILCGQLTIGSTGQFWLLLVADGLVGTVLYLGFFVYGICRFRRDTTPYGMAGVLVLLLGFVYMFAYVAVVVPLTFTMLAYALLWRNDQWMRSGTAEANAVESPSQAVRPSMAQTAVRAGAPFHTTYAAVLAPVEAAPSRPADGRLAEVARGGLFNLAGAGVAGLSTVAVTLVVTRSFSQAAAGAFFTATSLFLIIQAIGSLGAATGTVYFIARLRSIGQGHRVPEVLRSAIRPVAIVSITAAVALALAASPLARILVHGQFGHAGARPSEVASALRALAIALPFAAMLDTLLGATRGFRAMGPTNAVDRIGRSLVQWVGIAVVAAAGNAAWLAPLWALPYVPAVYVAWLWLRHIQRRSEADAVPVMPSPSVVNWRDRASRGHREEPLRFWRFTGPRGLAALAQSTIQRVDIVLVAIMRGPAEAAVYTAATRFLVIGQFGNQAISMASQPRFTEIFARGDIRGANRVYQVTTAWLVLLTWPMYLLAVSFGPQILTVFGHSYRTGADVMIILGLAMLLLTGCGQVDMVLVTTGRSSWSLANGLLAVTVNVGLDVLLIPRYGITGAAIGWAAAIVVANLMPLAQLAATVRLQPFGRGTVIAMALSTLSFYVLPLAARELVGRGAIPSLAAIACGCVLMAAGVWHFRADLHLAAMPGAAQITAAARRRLVRT